MRESITAMGMIDLEKETAMRGKTILIVSAVTFTFAAFGPAFASRDIIDNRDRQGGAVVPCSLVGVNPAYHPEIFANPAVAAWYGFVRSADGAWRVGPACRR